MCNRTRLPRRAARAARAAHVSSAWILRTLLPRGACVRGARPIDGWSGRRERFDIVWPEKEEPLNKCCSPSLRLAWWTARRRPRSQRATRIVSSPSRRPTRATGRGPEGSPMAPRQHFTPSLTRMRICCSETHTGCISATAHTSRWVRSTATICRTRSSSIRV